MATLVPRIYQGFRGVDFRGEECELFRSPDSLNMWKDYKETDSIRTRPGFKLFHEFSGTVGSVARINGLYFYKDAVLVHWRNDLWKLKDGERERLDPTIPGCNLLNVRSHGFVFEDKL